METTQRNGDVMTKSKAKGIFSMLVAVLVLVGYSTIDDKPMLLLWFSAINAIIAVYQFHIAEDDAE